MDSAVLRISNRNASTARLILTSTKRTIPTGWSLISLAKTDLLGHLVVSLAMTEVLLAESLDEPVAVLEGEIEIMIDTVVDPIVAVLSAEIHGETEIATEMSGDDSLMNMSSQTIILPPSR